MTNPLLTIQFEVPFDAIRADHVEPAIDELIRGAQAGIEAIVALEGPRTYDNTLGALERAAERLEWASSVISHLESVATYPEFRAAHDAIQPTLSEFGTSVILNRGLWQAIKDCAAAADAEGLAGTERRHLEKTLDDFRRHGAELNEEGRARLYGLNRQLAETTTKFAQNLLDATNRWQLVVTDEKQLAGLPDSAVEAARASAEAKGVEGWRFTLQEPSYVPVMTYLDDRHIRRQVWEAYDRRAIAPDLDNRPLIIEILELRREKAMLLGYQDFADLVLEDRMAHTGARAREFLAELRSKTLEYFEQENRTLEAFALERDPGIGQLEPWDLAYWAEKQRKKLYDFDQERLRPYYPIDRAVQGVFDVAQRLFDIRIERVEGMPVWDETVTTYRVLDRDGRHRASFYVDLHPRENKRGGAWMHGLITAKPSEPHLGLICANLNPPVGGKPSLLRQREVETIFHEFGHLLHHCLSDVPVRSLAGTHVAWDFVELPSQIMENWCWEREALDLFAHHWETAESIPDELFDKMQRAKTYRAANAQMRQTGFAAVDLALHREYDPDADGDAIQFARDILQQHTPVPLPKEQGFLATFGHLFSSPVGYAAAYYSYKWAEVLDADAFTRFRDEGIFNTDVGRAFREAVLSKGDSDDPMTLYKRFMGREPNIEPLLARQGLLTPVEERA